MSKTMMKQMVRTLRRDEGIAIGPILFIIAILGILASAIAAGSGSFTSSTTGEGNRAKAAALIDIGQTLKIGFDRLMGNGTAFSDIVIDPESTSNYEDLFSPIGGGVSAPSVTMAKNPGEDKWHYPLIRIPKLGTSAGSRVAVIRVDVGVCDEINKKVRSLKEGTAHNEVDDLGDFTDGEELNEAESWAPSLQGSSLGCVENNNSASEGYYFYQALSVQ
ncbi:MAG: hypothetical protein AB7S81_05580 [Bdellovibrionales bacterium]